MRERSGSQRSTGPSLGVQVHAQPDHPWRAMPKGVLPPVPLSKAG